MLVVCMVKFLAEIVSYLIEVCSKRLKLFLGAKYSAEKGEGETVEVTFAYNSCNVGFFVNFIFGGCCTFGVCWGRSCLD
jgi:hypothetical protein